jgi:uncharacterized protein
VIFLVQSQLGGSGGGSGISSGDAAGSSLDRCTSGRVANQDADCALVADVNSIQSYWTEALPRQAGTRYTPARTDLFRGNVSTGCGSATADVGPFYCPADKHVYLDTTFFEDMLEGRLGARGGEFSRAYVLAHEYGHHVQDLLGTMGRVRTQQGENSDAVRLELQADCYAGMWTRYATTTKNADGEVYILDLTEDDIVRALDAAAAVGDDRIQRMQGQGVHPEGFTHGSSEQRTSWFRRGFESGRPEDCDTFKS